MKISVKDKSRKKKVEVRTSSSEEMDTVPMPPEDYAVEDDPWNDADIADMAAEEQEDVFDEEESERKCKAYNRKALAEDLARLDPKEMRLVIRAARHLRKFTEYLDIDDEDLEDWR